MRFPSFNILEHIQTAAQSKSAFGLGAILAWMPAWIEFVHGPVVKALVVILGILVSLTIIIVNVQSIWHRRHKNKITEEQELLRLYLLRQQVKESKENGNK
jgi:hypothetical protein